LYTYKVHPYALFKMHYITYGGRKKKQRSTKGI
jgi:hypothetical protein